MMTRLHLSAGARRRPRASVLIIVLVTLLFTAAMLMAFIDKASTDLIVESRHIESDRLRQDAYSALEVTLAVLENFIQADGGVLRSPVEGWSDPLGFAGWEPGEGRSVDVTFEDESGKISLPRVDAATLTTLFESWNLTQPDAARLTDALMNWMRNGYVSSSTFTPDYDQGDLPYAVPGRSLLSFDELAAIDVASEAFYGDDGRPNDLWRHFVATFSLLNYRQPNINSAGADVLTALGGFEPAQQQKLSDYIAGAGSYQAQGPGYFRSAVDATAIIGQGNTSGFATQISALRIHVTVHDGRAVYRLNAVVTPPNGATTVQSSATNNPTATSASTAASQTTAARNTGTTGRNATSTSSTATANNSASTKKLNYPFTVLEISENDEPLPAAPPPPPPNA